MALQKLLQRWSSVAVATLLAYGAVVGGLPLSLCLCPPQQCSVEYVEQSCCSGEEAPCDEATSDGSAGRCCRDCATLLCHDVCTVPSSSVVSPRDLPRVLLSLLSVEVRGASISVALSLPVTVPSRASAFHSRVQLSRLCVLRC
jgi:hypothetical protein